MTLRLPIPLANHIAKVCDLPSLFPGEYGGTRIEYIWITQRTYAFDSHDGILPSPVLVIKSNKRLRGILARSFEGGLSAFVDLSDWVDTLQVMLEEYEKFPCPESVLDGSTLYVSYLTTEHMKAHRLSDPDMQTPLTKRFDIVCRDAIGHIVDLINEGKYIKGSQFDYFKMLETEQQLFKQSMWKRLRKHNLLKQYKSEPKPFDFLRLYEYALRFGLSGLFGHADEPHDLVYILEIFVDDGRVNHNTYDPRYTLIKTHRWVKVATPRTIFGEIPDPQLDWRDILGDWRGHMFTDQKTPRKLYRFHYIDQEGQVYGEYDELDTSTKSLLTRWQIEHLIELIEESKSE